MPGAATGLSLLAALSWGAGDFSGGFATRRASPFLVVCVAHGFSFLLLLAFRGQAGPPNLQLARLGILAGIAGGVALIAFYQALSLGEMGVTAALGGVLSAAIPVGFSIVTVGSPKPLQLAGFAVAAVAIWLIAYAPGSQTHVRGLLLATLRRSGLRRLPDPAETHGERKCVLGGYVFAGREHGGGVLAAGDCAVTAAARVAFAAPRLEAGLADRRSGGAV